MKILQAKLKEEPVVAINLDVDFTSDWVSASSVIESAKKQLLRQLKQDLHEKIAVLDIDDLNFHSL